MWSLSPPLLICMSSVFFLVLFFFSVSATSPILGETVSACVGRCFVARPIDGPTAKLLETRRYVHFLFFSHSHLDPSAELSRISRIDLYAERLPNQVSSLTSVQASEWIVCLDEKWWETDSISYRKCKRASSGVARGWFVNIPPRPTPSLT